LNLEQVESKVVIMDEEKPKEKEIKEDI